MILRSASERMTTEVEIPARNHVFIFHGNYSGGKNKEGKREICLGRPIPPTRNRSIIAGERARAQQHRRPRLQSNDDDDDGDDDDDNGDLVRTSVVVVMMPPSSADRPTPKHATTPLLSSFPLSSLRSRQAALLPPQAHLLTRLWAAEPAFTPINLGRATTTSLSPAQSPRVGLFLALQWLHVDFRGAPNSRWSRVRCSVQELHFSSFRFVCPPPSPFPTRRARRTPPASRFLPLLRERGY